MKKANSVWQVILELSRYAGLRTPSKTLSLRWDDIDWEMSRMSIPEPKVEHHEGRGIRSCPIFPELRPLLDEAFEIFGDTSEYVVAAPQYRATGTTGPSTYFVRSAHSFSLRGCQKIARGKPRAATRISPKREPALQGLQTKRHSTCPASSSIALRVNAIDNLVQN
ncbi:MAG: hypothetical protein WCK86_23605 [Planctomycetia bacterium]